MNKKIKQVIAIALALVMCAGALLSDPFRVYADKPFADVVDGFVPFSYFPTSHTTSITGVTQNEFVLSDNSSFGRYCFCVCYSNVNQYHIYVFDDGSFSGEYQYAVRQYIGDVYTDDARSMKVSNISYNGHAYSICDLGYFVDYGSDDSWKCHVPMITLEEYTGNLSDLGYLVDACVQGQWEGIGWTNPEGSSSTYEDAVDELGYIQNITTATKNVNLMYANQHSIPVIKFSFSTTTSTGKKIYEEGMDVQYMLTARSFESESDYSQKNVYKSAKSDLFFVSKNPNIYDEENSLNKGFFNFSAASDTWQSMHSEIKDGMSLFANMVYDREFFIRPVYRESIFAPIKYGGWSRVEIDAFGKTHVIEGTIEGGENNPDATPDSDGQLDNSNNQYDSDHKIGSGDNESDAESNSKDASDILGSDFVDSFKDFDLSSLSNILGQLGNAASAFADLLGVVFGWMPTWVRGSLIAAVCIWIFMLIKRAIF